MWDCSYTTGSKCENCQYYDICKLRDIIDSSDNFDCDPCDGCDRVIDTPIPGCGVYDGPHTWTQM